MQNDKAIPESKEVCDAVIEKVGKPDNDLFCKAMNVFDDRYRVNVYTRVWRGEDKDLEGMSISQSYFVKYSDKGVLTIVSQSR